MYRGVDTNETQKRYQNQTITVVEQSVVADMSDGFSPHYSLRNLRNPKPVTSTKSNRPIIALGAMMGHFSTHLFLCGFLMKKTLFDYHNRTCRSNKVSKT